ASMSPWFTRPRPAACSTSLRAWSFVPPSTVASRVAASRAVMPLKRSRETKVPSVATSGVKEWPLPTTRSVRPAAAAARTTSRSSSTLAGSRRSAGRQLTAPDQLRKATGIRPSQEAAPVAAVGLDLVDDAVVADQRQGVEALAQLSRLGVAKEDRVPELQVQRAAVGDGRLDLPGALPGEQARSLRQVRQWKLVRSGGARGDVASAVAGEEARPGAARDREGEAGGGPVAEGPVGIEQRRREEARARGQLGHA